MARDNKMIAALRRERAGYLQRGDDDRVRQVDEQLAHYGYKPAEQALTDPDGGPKGRDPEGGKRTADGGQSAAPAGAGDPAAAAQTPPAKKTAARKAAAKKTAPGTPPATG